MDKFWETTERAYCYNCRYFMSDVMAGDGKVKTYIGYCAHPDRRKRTEADDCCPGHIWADWTKENEVKV